MKLSLSYLLLSTVIATSSMVHADELPSRSIPTDNQLLLQIKNSKIVALSEAYKDLLVKRAVLLSEGKQDAAAKINQSISSVETDMIDVTIDYLSARARSSEDSNEDTLMTLGNKIDYFIRERTDLKERLSKKSDNTAEQGAAANP